MITCDTVLALRSETEFVKFWDMVNKQKVSEVGINDQVLPRKRRVPVRFEEGNCDPQYPLPVIDLYINP